MNELDAFYDAHPEPYQESADIQDREVALLKQSADERRNRRRLFFRAMRHPEMRVLRAALVDLKWDKGIDWHTITSLDIDPPSLPYNTTWTAMTDTHLIVCYWPEYEHMEFDLYQLHDAENPACDCLFCS